MGYTRDCWDDERLDRLANTVEANTQAISLLSQRTEIIAVAVDRLADVQLQTLQRIDTMQTQISEMQSEVRGLQTENRRIWEILLRRNGGEPE